MTSNRLVSVNLWPLSYAIFAVYVIYAALITICRVLARTPRRTRHWVHGLLTTPLHKKDALGHEPLPRPPWQDPSGERVADTGILCALGHETHAWPAGSLSSPWPTAGGPPWSPQAEPETTSLTMVPDPAPPLTALPNVPGPVVPDETAPSGPAAGPGATSEPELCQCRRPAGHLEQACWYSDLDAIAGEMNTGTLPVIQAVATDA